jgi:4-amino-4-deoxy-L-arabinose transferase-like glycosyltransferase
MKFRRILLLFLAALAFYLIFNSLIPVTDPVESNYALTAKEMLLSGDWMSPRIYGHFWYDKPVMIYWLLLFSYKIFGITEFASRLPSAVMAALTVAFVYWFAEKLYGNRRTALLSAVVLGTSLEFWVLARMIITDATLMLFSSVALALLYLGVLEKRRKWYVLAYISAGLAVLTKGPVGIVLPGLAMLLYIAAARRWGLLRKLFLIPGTVVFLAVTGPWYYYMYQVHGSAFIDIFFGMNNFVRATVSEHPDSNVFYYYLVLFPVSLLPWTGVFFGAVIDAVKNRKAEHTLFLLVWPAVILVFYTLMATKYPTYVFPAAFPTAILIGKYLSDRLDRWERKSWLMVTLPTLLLLGLFVKGMKVVAPSANLVLMDAVAAAGTVWIIWAQYRGSGRRVLQAVTLVTMAAVIILIGQGLTSYSDMRSAKALMSALPARGAQVACYGDYDTSAVFYSGYLIPKLVDNHAELVFHGAWADKYTMPTETDAHFNRRTEHNQNTYILMRKTSIGEFEKSDIGKQFTPVAEHKKMILLKRVM